MGSGDLHETTDSSCAVHYKGRCKRIASMRPEQGTLISRAQAIAALLELLTDQPGGICNGFPSREAHKFADRLTLFFLIGFMGDAQAIALGVALAKPNQQVVVFDGDGNVLMGM